MPGPSLLIPVDIGQAEALTERAALDGKIYWKVEIDEGAGYIDRTAWLDNNQVQISGKSSPLKAPEASQATFVLRNSPLLFNVGDLAGYPIKISVAVDNAGGLIDRGNCESATPPMIFGETVPALSNATFARSGDFYHTGTYSYKLTKTVAAGTAAAVRLVDNGSIADMHGLIAGNAYTFAPKVLFPTGCGIAPNVLQLSIYDYLGAWQYAYSDPLPNTYDEWLEITVSRTLRAGCVAAGFLYYLPAAVAINKYFYTDNLSLLCPTHKRYLQVFTGYISPSGCSRAKQSLTNDKIQITAFDLIKSRGLGRKVRYAAYVGKHICDTADEPNSLAHIIAAQMGLVTANLDFLSIMDVKDYVGHDGSTTAWRELQDLALQHGAFLGVRYDGKLRLLVWTDADWNAAAPEYTFDDTNVHSIKADGGEKFCNKAKTQYMSYEVLPAGSIAYQNYDNWNDDTFINEVVVNAGEYWPGGTDDKAVGRLNYQYGTEKYPVAINIITPIIGDLGTSDIVCSGGLLSIVAFNNDHRELSFVVAGYVNCVAGDIGKPVVGTISGDTGTLTDYNNTDKTWVIATTDAFDIAEGITITGGTGAGTTSGGSIAPCAQNPDSSEIILKNRTAGAITINRFVIRGTPLRELADRTVEYLDSGTLNEWDQVVQEISGKYAVSDAKAMAICQRWVEFGHEARGKYEVLADFTPHIQCGAVVTLNPTADINLDCFVEAYTHISKGSPSQTRTRMILIEKVARGALAAGKVIATSTGTSPLPPPHTIAGGHLTITDPVDLPDDPIQDSATVVMEYFDLSQPAGVSNLARKPEPS
jgi:hypothetical protein